MTKQELMRMTALIDDRYLTQAVAVPKRRRHFIAAAWTAAVCAAVCAGTLMIVYRHRTLPAATHPADSYPAVYIEKADPPSPQIAASGDAIGFLLYDDRLYWQECFYHDDDFRRVEALIGDRVGTADGSYAWSCIGTPEEYHPSGLPDAIPSNICGEVFTVKGYDKAFRLCVPFSYADGSRTLCVYECLSGISYRSGRDIFDQRLHLPGRVTGVFSVSSEDDSQHERDISPELIRQWVNALCDAQARNRSDCLTEQEQIYGGKTIVLLMEDGMQNTFLLYEGGYAAYGGCFVQFHQKEAFSALYALL